MAQDDNPFDDPRDREKAASLSEALADALNWQRATEYRLKSITEDTMHRLRVGEELCEDSKTISAVKRQRPNRVERP
jgi:hypothetical protein